MFIENSVNGADNFIDGRYLSFLLSIHGNSKKTEFEY